MLVSQFLLLFGVDLLAKAHGVAVLELARAVHGRKLRMLILRGIDHALTKLRVLLLDCLIGAVDRLLVPA